MHNVMANTKLHVVLPPTIIYLLNNVVLPPTNYHLPAQQRSITTYQLSSTCSTKAVQKKPVSLNEKCWRNTHTHTQNRRTDH